MTPQQVDPVLRETFEDGRMSRAEKQTLPAALGEVLAKKDGASYVRHRAFALAREFSKRDQDAALAWLEAVVKVLANDAASRQTPTTSKSVAYFSPGDSCLRCIQREIAQAKTQIDVCVFTITDNRITDALFAAHKQGTAIRIITDNDKSLDRGSDIERLAQAGLAVRMDRSEHHMHHKYAIFDDKKLLTGSYNWTRSAALYNRENIALIVGGPLLESYQASFEDLWQQLK